MRRVTFFPGRTVKNEVESDDTGYRGGRHRAWRLGVRHRAGISATTFLSPSQKALAAEQPAYATRYKDLNSTTFDMAEWNDPPRYVKLDSAQWAELKKKISQLNTDYAKAFDEAAESNEKRKADASNAEAGKKYDDALANLKKIFDESTEPLKTAMDAVKIGNENRQAFPSQPTWSEAMPRR
jgi:hypothetical protein